MKAVVSMAVALTATTLVVAPVAAQPSPVQLAQATTPQPGPGEEIRLDEQTTLKAAATEAKMSAILANFALLQRQAQDMQNELKGLLDERKKLIEDAGKKQRVDVKDTNEWAFENNRQRYVKMKKAP
jgi:hypothetical protein